MVHHCEDRIFFVLHGINEVNIFQLVFLNDHHLIAETTFFIICLKGHAEFMKMQTTSLLLHLVSEALWEFLEESRLSVLDPVDFSHTERKDFVKSINVISTLDH